MSSEAAPALMNLNARALVVHIAREVEFAQGWLNGASLAAVGVSIVRLKTRMLTKKLTINLAELFVCE